MIFYFTATGNSLYVAKQFGQELVSIPQAMKEPGRTYEADSIGIVCPIYAGEAPRIVMEFLKSSKLVTPYLYLILTYGSSDSDAPEFITRQLAEMEVKVSYVHTICMVDNYIPVFDMNEQKAMDKQVNAQIAKALADVKARVCEIPEATEDGREKHRMVAERFAQHPELNNGELLVTTDACIGCGLCAKVCPVGNLEVKNGKAVRKNAACEFCLACVHNCPKKAITLSMGERNPNARYRNENITVQEIIASNQQ